MILCVYCRFAYILVDVDFYLKQVVDCRSEGQKRCFLHFRGALPHRPQINKISGQMLEYIKRDPGFSFPGGGGPGPEGGGNVTCFGRDETIDQ